MASPIDIRHLKSFIAVFEERSITAAARTVHLSQPALSASIKLLEDSLGTVLFKRQARGVEVTDDGRSLYPHAKRMAAEFDRLTTRFRTGATREKLIFGLENDIGRSQVREFLESIAASVPHVMLELQFGCVGDVRLGAEESRCEDELFLPLWTEPYVIATSRLSSSNNGDHKPDTMASNWVMYPSHSSHQRLLPIYGIGIDNPAAIAGSFSLMLDLVAAGVGNAIAPRSLVAEHPDVCELGPLEFDFERRIGLCLPAPALENPSIAKIYESRAKQLESPVDSVAR